MIKKIAIMKKIIRNKALLLAFIISLFWSISLFLAPLTVPPGSVQGLDGNANRLDYGELWNDFPIYPKSIYSIGDAQCHQKWYRSFSLNGNQMPVDARSSAIYISLTIGLFTAMLATPTFIAAESFVSIFPRRIQEFVHRRNCYDEFTFLILALFIVPMAMDGTIQMITSYESTNLMRVITGTMFGWVSGLFIGVIITSMGVLNYIKLNRK